MHGAHLLSDLGSRGVVLAVSLSFAPQMGKKFNLASPSSVLYIVTEVSVPFTAFKVLPSVGERLHSFWSGCLLKFLLRTVPGSIPFSFQSAQSRRELPATTY